MGLNDDVIEIRAHERRLLFARTGAYLWRFAEEKCRVPQVETRIFHSWRDLIFRSKRNGPVYGPDPGKCVGALVYLQAAVSGEGIHVICVPGSTANPIFGSIQHSGPLAVVPEAHKTRRNARDIAAEDIQPIPVAIVEWKLLAVHLNTKGPGLASQPLQNVLVLRVFIEVDGAVLVQPVDVRIAGGISQIHHEQQQTANTQRRDAEVPVLVTQIERGNQQSQHGNQHDPVVVIEAEVFAHHHTQHEDQHHGARRREPQRNAARPRGLAMLAQAVETISHEYGDAEVEDHHRHGGRTGFFEHRQHGVKKAMEEVLMTQGQKQAAE